MWLGEVEVPVGARVRRLAWSPGGERLAVSAEGALVMLARDGGEVARLSGVPWAEPTWSPDGRFLAIISGFRAGLLTDSDGAVVLEAERQANRATFSPDGTLLGFARAPNGVAALYRLPIA